MGRQDITQNVASVIPEKIGTKKWYWLLHEMEWCSTYSSLKFMKTIEGPNVASLKAGAAKSLQ